MEPSAAVIVGECFDSDDQSGNSKRTASLQATSDRARGHATQNDAGLGMTEVDQARIGARQAPRPIGGEAYNSYFLTARGENRLIRFNLFDE